MTRPIVSTTAAFAPATLDKVERLLEVLDTVHRDPLLAPAFVLHGGTAQTVFLDDLPRLSVDIDVLYVGSADADGMRLERPLVDARLREITAKLGYKTRATNDEHSGQTCSPPMTSSTSPRCGVSWRNFSRRSRSRLRMRPQIRINA